MAFSDVGVSKTLASPNSSCKPSVVPKTPFGSGTPSPYVITSLDSFIAVNIASFIASAKVIFLIILRVNYLLKIFI